MVSVLFVIFVSLLASLAISALFFTFVIYPRCVSLPLSFLLTQFVLALLIRPVLDIATYIWHLLPVFLIYSALPLLVFSLFASLLYTTITLISGNVSTAFNLLGDQFLRFSPLDIDEDVYQSWNFVTTSIDDFFERANFTEIFQNIVIKTQTQQQDDIFTHFRRGFAMSFGVLPEDLGQVRENLTISDETQQFVENINVAVVHFLEDIHVENVLNVTRIPSDLVASLHKVTDALKLLAKDINFTTLIKHGTVSSSAEKHFQQFTDTLNTAADSFNLKQLSKTAVLQPLSEGVIDESAAAKLAPLLTDPFQFFLSGGDPNKKWQLKEVVLMFLKSNWQYILLLILLVSIALPLAFFLRAALQDGCLWLITNRYKSVIPSAQRSVSGWMFIAAISGLALAITEALPFCYICFYLYFSNLGSNTRVLSFFILHALKGAPLRTASHMRVAEGVAENDVLKEKTSGVWKGLFVAAQFNSTFFVWWFLSTAIYLVLPLTETITLAVILIDIAFLIFSIAWGRRIFRRMVEKEQRWQEAQDRKRD